MKVALRLSACPLLALVLATTGIAQWHQFGETSGHTAGASTLARDMIAEHNAVRSRVGTSALTWSDSLAVVAQEWANHLLASGQFAHSRNPNYGENLYEITGAAATSAEVVRAWAGESRDYEYRSNSCRATCGHYTQIVWNDTKQTGCAVARGNNREIWVCEYDPPGNWVGKRPY
jgi:uncharacterized protein YkwD